MTVGLDPAQLVLIAAAAAVSDPGDVLDQTDMAVLTAISRRSAAAPTTAAAAAETLVGIAASRPFPGANEATAWLAATHLIKINGAHLVIDDAAAIGLVASAAAGQVDERVAAERLAAALHRRRGRMVKAMRWLFVASPSAGPIRWKTSMCPRCGREVVTRVFVGAFPGVPTPRECVAICAIQHRTHGRYDDIDCDFRLETLSAELDDLRARLVLR